MPAAVSLGVTLPLPGRAARNRGKNLANTRSSQSIKIQMTIESAILEPQFEVSVLDYGAVGNGSAAAKVGFSTWCFSVGPVRAHMGPCGPIWAHTGPYGPIWAHMGPYGPHAKTPCTKTHLSSSRYGPMYWLLWSHIGTGANHTLVKPYSSDRMGRGAQYSWNQDCNIGCC